MPSAWLPGVLTGALWGSGNLCSLCATKHLGVAVGFPLTQTCIVVSWPQPQAPTPAAAAAAATAATAVAVAAAARAQSIHRTSPLLSQVNSTTVVATAATATAR